MFVFNLRTFKANRVSDRLLADHCIGTSPMRLPSEGFNLPFQAMFRET
jgi:hypothetical protein